MESDERCLFCSCLWIAVNPSGCEDKLIAQYDTATYARADQLFILKRSILFLCARTEVCLVEPFSVLTSGRSTTYIYSVRSTKDNYHSFLLDNFLLSRPPPFPLRADTWPLRFFPWKIIARTSVSFFYSYDLLVLLKFGEVEATSSRFYGGQMNNFVSYWLECNLPC